MEEARNLSTILDLFADFFGLQINRAKSAFVGFELTHEESLQCLEALGTPIGTLPMRYLGLHLMRGRMLRTDWNPVIEKVERRLEDRAFGVASISTYRDPYFLSFSIQITYRSREEARRIDEEILVEQIWVRTTQWASISLMGSCV